jgi:hypothetical protein
LLISTNVRFHGRLSAGAHEGAAALFGDAAVAALHQMHARRPLEAQQKQVPETAAFHFPDLARMDASATATPGPIYLMGSSQMSTRIAFCYSELVDEGLVTQLGDEVVLF